MKTVLPTLLASAYLILSGAPVAEESTAQSQGLYRLPFADGSTVRVFDDFATHRPRGRIDLFAVEGREPYRVVAAADGRIMAIQDGYSEQQSGRAAADCRNNYVWIAHANGEWTNYSHHAHDSVTKGARYGLNVSAWLRCAITARAVAGDRLGPATSARRPESVLGLPICRYGSD